MTSQRTQAYMRVMKRIRDVGPAKLLRAEQELIRHSADQLLLDEDFEPMFAVLELVGRLVESERWTRESALGLAADVAACGGIEMRLEFVATA